MVLRSGNSPSRTINNRSDASIDEITGRFRDAQVVDTAVPNYLVARARRVPAGYLSDTEESFYTDTGILTNSVTNKSWVPLLNNGGVCTELFHESIEAHKQSIDEVYINRVRYRDIVHILGRKCFRDITHDVSVCLSCRVPICLHCQDMPPYVWCPGYWGHFHKHCHDHQEMT
jgi:hypothetical protein